MLRPIAALSLGLFTACVGVGPPSPDEPRHLLDPLTAEEMSAVTAVLQAEGYTSEAGLYPLITLDEPPKADVLAWRPGDPLAPRRAFVVLMRGHQTFEGVVDLDANTVVSWEEIEGVQPPILLSEEWTFVQRLVFASAEWRETIARRGVTDLRHVVCVPKTVGNHGLADERGRRLVKVVCYDGEGTYNYWGRPIEGVLAVVDLHSREVRVVDTGAVPIPRTAVDLYEAAVGEQREPPNPISMTQPGGPSFGVDGHLVKWQKWRFHVRLHPRMGLVLSTVGYQDDGDLREVLYQGSLSELFVPYMDPSIGWYFRTYLDAGEFGVGKLAVPLEREIDCPRNAFYFDAVLADDRGEPRTIERAICLFERYAGDIAWRHSEAANGVTEARRRTDLVVRSISAIGNYDYVFDWTFRQDGAIRVAVGATGVEQVKAVAHATVAGAAADSGESDDDLRYGRMVAEGTLAVNHDHFFSFRLDLDVDGPRNTFLQETLRTERTVGESPRASVWVVDSKPLETESAARLRIRLEEPALWRVINPDVTGPVGYPVSYQLRPEANAVSLLSSDDPLRRRAGFTNYHLWVTPHDPGERYAAGAYPNQSEGGDGLPNWTSDDRPIEGTDIVLWYTVGFHHVVRAEDWPVLPTGWSAFELRPFDFFERNPALDIPLDR